MLSINLLNLKKNVSEIIDDRKLIGVVKNNAYGCGVNQISDTLISLGVDTLFVNDINEALEIIDKKVDIIVHNSFPNLELCEKYPNLIITINSLEDSIIARNLIFNIRCHIQIDTKMNRLGIKDFDEYLEILKLLDCMHIKIEGIYTHFASPKSAPSQLIEFQKYVDMYPYKVVHCAATSTFKTIKYGTHVRVGLGLYDINQVMSVKTKPLSLRKLKKGESLGYDSLYTAQSDEMIAILPIGYGNGYTRKLEGFKVYCEGKFYPLLGRICMNHLFVRIDEDVTLDSIFELTSENLKAGELAEYLHCTNYEIYTNFKFKEVEYIS